MESNIRAAKRLSQACCCSARQATLQSSPPFIGTFRKTDFQNDNRPLFSALLYQANGGIAMPCLRQEIFLFTARGKWEKRYIEIEISPFSFAEYILVARNSPNISKDESLGNFVTEG
jgi:hypothetical protein